MTPESRSKRGEAALKFSKTRFVLFFLKSLAKLGRELRLKHFALDGTIPTIEDSTNARKLSRYCSLARCRSKAREGICDSNGVLIYIFQALPLEAIL
jgi:hypothetical protein